MKTILIVEDDLNIQELLTFNLKKEGYFVLVSSDGDDALLKIKQNSVDLILLDLMIPKVMGPCAFFIESIRSVGYRMKEE